MTRRRRERGQGVVETALALPLLLCLALGLFQAGFLLWTRVRLQHAAQAAARAYTVWQPEDETLAKQKALSAAWLALRPAPSGLTLDLQVLDASFMGLLRPTLPTPYKEHGPLTHALRLRAHLKAWPGLVFFNDGFDLKADAAILREDTDERAVLSKQP